MVLSYILLSINSVIDWIIFAGKFMNCAVIDGALMDSIDIGFAAIDGVSNIEVDVTDGN